MARILYIDDNKADIELMRLLLGARGIELDEALSGAKGLEAYDPSRHCAVVIDWNLRDMEGIEVARRLRARYPDCLMMMLSGTLDSFHRKDAAEVLGDGMCLEKSTSMEHIRRIGEFVAQAPQPRPLERERHG